MRIFDQRTIRRNTTQDLTKLRNRSMTESYEALRAGNFERAITCLKEAHFHYMVSEDQKVKFEKMFEKQTRIHLLERKQPNAEGIIAGLKQKYYRIFDDISGF